MTQAKWAVTGAAGFLGSHLVEQLLERGHEVVGLDDFSTGRRELLAPFSGRAGFELVELDIRDASRLERALADRRPACVAHLAALHFIPTAVADPARTVSINVHGTQCVLSACRSAGVGRVWVASTGDVYAPSEQPHREESALKPFNIYGLSKLMAEQCVALEARARPDAAFVVGRFLNLYGPRETNPHILPEILRQLAREPEAPLRLGSLWPRRDFVPVADAARAVIESAERAPAGLTTLNVATGAAFSMEEAVRLIGEARGRPLKVETDPAKVRPVERAHLQCDVSRLRALIGWAPHSDLRRGLRELLEHEGLLG